MYLCLKLLNFQKFKKVFFHFLSGGLLFFLLGGASFVQAVELPPCEPPETLKELHQTLVSEMSAYDFSGPDQTPFFYRYISQQSYKKLEQKIGTEFPENFDSLFQAYIKSFQTLDQKFQAANNQTEKEVPSDLKKLWYFHRYLLEQALPTIVIHDEFFILRQSGSDPLIEQKANAIINRLYQKDFSAQNIIACKNEKLNRRKKKEVRPEGPYIIKLDPNKALVGAGLFFPYYTIPLSTHEVFDTWIQFKTEPDARHYKSALESPWLYRAACFVGQRGAYSCPGKKQSETDSLSFFKGDFKSLTLEARQNQLKNEKNYWLNRTAPVSAHYTDTIVERFETLLDGIAKINASLGKSLEHTLLICQKQDIIPNDGKTNVCWKKTADKKIPEHIDMTIKKYEKRSYIPE